MNFKTWVEHKKIKDHDLIFAKSLKTDQQLGLFEEIANKMASHEPSFSEGLIFLEYATELILMDKTTDLQTDSHDFQKWLIQLKKLRYPQTTLSDEHIKAKYMSLPWPHGSKVKFERRGDKSGVEIKLFVSNQTDVNKLIASLERVQKEL